MGDVTLRDDYRVYNQGGAMGFNITMDGDITTPRHMGCWTPIPRTGDVLIVRMKSGKTGAFIFTEVTRWRDPSDGFAARSVFVGYVGEQFDASLKGVAVL